LLSRHGNDLFLSTAQSQGPEEVSMIVTILSKTHGKFSFGSRCIRQHSDGLFTALRREFQAVRVRRRNWSPCPK
jgi:hypothetical protein